MKYKLAVFDMDGTILNTLEDLADSTNYALKKHGLPEKTLEEVRGFVGNGIGKLIERAIPQGSDRSVYEQVFETFNEYYKDHCGDKTRAYEGIQELLTKIRDSGMKTAVVSNKADYGVQELCREYFPGLFDYAVGEKEGIRRKPCPDSVNEVLRQMGVTKEEAVYIGDSDVDFETSRNAQMDVIMVGWGFRTESFLMECGAPFVAHSTEEVWEKLK